MSDHDEVVFDPATADTFVVQKLPFPETDWAKAVPVCSSPFKYEMEKRCVLMATEYQQHRFRVVRYQNG